MVFSFIVETLLFAGKNDTEDADEEEADNHNNPEVGFPAAWSPPLSKLADVFASHPSGCGLPLFISELNILKRQ